MTEVLELPNINTVNCYSDFGIPTIVNDIPYFIDEFWTSRQRQAHPIHEISYRACFKPQLPAFFINRLTNPGDVVYDPFMGRGTTPIETMLNNRVPFGNDINPICRTLTEPRINAPDLSTIQKRLEKIPWSTFTSYDHADLLVFYHPKTLAQLEGLRKWFLSRKNIGGFDKVDHWIEMVAVNRLTGHSPGFFSVYTLPPNQAVSIDGQKKINKKRNQKPPLRDIPSLILKKSTRLLSQPAPQIDDYKFLTCESHKTSGIPDDSIDLTVTSPPFLDIVNYEKDNWLRCWFLGIDSSSINISQYNKLEDWNQFVRNTLKELARITKPGGHIAFEVGEVRKGSIRLDEHVVNVSVGLSFDIVGVVVNKQSFTKTSNCWGISNNKEGTNTNRIVILRKEENGI
ncbi:MAG: DNA methyltransferase [Rhodobacteraceae bacterium]|nr:DNA methyltransferase [Paracoccaceae bacterium]MDE2738231.1 DNA methyltransferase [Paracoccaceae bacterium]